MGATLSGLESRGLIARSTDPDDGRRVVFGLTTAGSGLLESNQDVRTQVLDRALTDNFSKGELARLRATVPLLERLGRVI